MIECGALVFDMDGLMVDSEPLWFEVERAFARSRGGDWTAALADACIGQGMARTLRTMHERFGFEVDVERDAAIVVDAFVERVGELALKRGCLELLEAARAHGVRCAVASSSARRLVEATLGRFALLERFAAVVTGDCVARPKPAPDIFLEAAARLRVPARACVVLEDSPAGVRAARAAGMRVIAVPDRVPFRDVGVSAPDALATDLHAAGALLSWRPVLE